MITMKKEINKTTYMVGINDDGTKIYVACKNSELCDTKKMIEVMFDGKLTLLETSFIPYKLFSWGYYKLAFYTDLLICVAKRAIC